MAEGSGQIEVPAEIPFSGRAFARHFLEMFLAMAVGMAVLDQVARVAFSLIARIDLFANTELFAFIMTIDMTIGMALWMAYRRHTARSITEMSGAMFLPLCLLIGPHWAGMLPGRALLAGSMALSIPAMLLLMFYRRDVYGRSHHHHHHHPHHHPAPD